MARLEDLRIVANGLDHPEGIATGPDGELYAGGEAGQVYRIDRETQTAEEIANTGGFVLGLCHDSAGIIYACDMSSRGAVLRIDPASGQVSDYCATAGGQPLVTPNYPSFGADGTLWFTDSGTEDMNIRDGRLIRVGPGGGDGEVVPLPPMHFPNGMCVGPDGAVYVLETLTPRLSRIDVDGGGIEVIADLPGTTPDGVALCADGSFLIACYYPFQVLRVPAGGGGFEIVLDDPVGIHLPMPTNISFFGAQLELAAIASLGGWAVRSIDFGLRGAPLHYPDI